MNQQLGLMCLLSQGRLDLDPRVGERSLPSPFLRQPTPPSKVGIFKEGPLASPVNFLLKPQRRVCGRVNRKESVPSRQRQTDSPHSRCNVTPPARCATISRRLSPIRLQ